MIKVIFATLLVVAAATQAEANKKCFTVTTPKTTQATDPPEPSCGNNEFYNSCGSPCVITCDEPLPKPCVKMCKAGCFCQNGYIRDSKGKCILKKDCPKPACTRKHEVYSECGANACQAACADPDFPKACRAMCIAGCICGEGYIRDDNGNCISPKQCPKTEVCKKKHEEYTDCGPASGCEISCDMPTGGFICPAVCVAGCFCEERYIRDSNGNCVLEDDCPKCPNKNEEYSGCGGSPCQATCENPDLPKMCKAPCKPGCGCKEGFLRNANLDCVTPKQCLKPNECGKNEIWADCSGSCREGSCTILTGSFTCKPKQECTAGCKCDEGFYRNDKQQCVKPSECPARECRANQVWSKCDKKCDKRCRDIIDRPRDCFMMGCHPGCNCKSGYYRNEHDTCIPREECPEAKLEEQKLK